ncbi:MAG: hypothetical protein ACYSTI_13195 [Planctomycetota bacterium]
MTRIKPHTGRPALLSKGGAHDMDRDLDYHVEVEWGLLEYEEQQMAKQLPVGGHVEVLHSTGG